MESLNRRTLLGAAAAAVPLAVAPGLATSASASPDRPQPKGLGKSPRAVLPNVLDAGHATRSAAALFRGYYSAKSSYDADAMMQFFSEGQMAYYDSVFGIGGVFSSNAVFFSEIMAPTLAGWAKSGGKSYPIRILGDTNSAIVFFRNTPELFGDEIRVIASFTLEQGKVVRVADFWDGRGNAALKLRDPNARNPRGLGVETVRENADRVINTFARRLGSTLAAGDIDGAQALFSDDAVFEDMTTRTRVFGRAAITRYLRRALSRLPYGPRSEVLHVLGSEQGGGYEWVTDNDAVPNGVTALQLDRVGDYKDPAARTHKITRLTTVWDGSRLDDSVLRSLTALSLEA